MKKTNFHTHNRLCGHATGDIKDYVIEAIAKGYSEIGMSDHGPLDNAPFPRMSYQQFETIYLKEIADCKEKFKDKIKIFSGLEMEYTDIGDEYYKKLLTKVDYLILAIHYIKKSNSTSLDSAAHCNTHDKLDQYVSLACEGMKTGFFKILAHPDIFMLGYYHYDQYALDKMKELIDCAISNNVILEINANGIRNCQGRVNHYPTIEFFELAKSMGAKIMINSDCHTPESLDDEAMDEARQMAKNLKIELVESIFE